MKYGIREICDVVLKAKASQKIGNKIFYKDEPVLYFDTLKTSTMEGAATTVYAQGGRGNSRLVAWEGERTVTFTMEDALISPTGFAILSGAGLIEADKNNTIKVHQFEMLNDFEKSENINEIRLKLTSPVAEYKLYNTANPEGLKSFTSRVNNGYYYGVMLLKEHLNFIKKKYSEKPETIVLDDNFPWKTLPDYNLYNSNDDNIALFKLRVNQGVNDWDFINWLYGDDLTNTTGIILRRLEIDEQSNYGPIYGFNYDLKSLEFLNGVFGKFEEDYEDFEEVFTIKLPKISLKELGAEIKDYSMGTFGITFKNLQCFYYTNKIENESKYYVCPVNSYLRNDQLTYREVDLSYAVYTYTANNKWEKKSEGQEKNIEDLKANIENENKNGTVALLLSSWNEKNNKNELDTSITYKVYSETDGKTETLKEIKDEGGRILKYIIKNNNLMVFVKNIVLDRARFYVTKATDAPPEGQFDSFMVIKEFQIVQGQSELQTYVPYNRKEDNKFYLKNIFVMSGDFSSALSDYIKRVDDFKYLILDNSDKIFDLNNQFLVDYYTEVASGAQQIEITPDKFGGNYYLEAATLFRTQDGADVPANFIIPNCKIQSNFNFTMASSGDPSTFTFTMDAFPDYLRFDKSKKVLAAIQLINDNKPDNSITRDRTKSNIKLK